MLIPSLTDVDQQTLPSLSRRVNANSQHPSEFNIIAVKLIKKGEC